MNTNTFKLALTLIANRVGFNHLSRISLGRHVGFDRNVFLNGGAKQGILLQIGDYVTLRRGVYLSANQSGLNIGQHCYFGHNSWVGGLGNIEIGSNSMFGMNVVVISSNHNYLNIGIPYHAQPEIPDDIKIGRNVWIGANSVILPGVTIGDGAVIGAGTVVTKDVLPNVLAVGNPARQLAVINRSEGDNSKLRPNYPRDYAAG